MLPSPDDILYFIEIAKIQNISRAAERLGITQPTLSQSVKRLEKNIGEKLLIRSKTGVKLTKFGQHFLQGSYRVLQEWEKLKVIAAQENECVQGSFSIGCHPSVALYSLAEFLPKLLQEYPRLHIDIVHDISRHITEKVISHHIDFGIVVNPVEHLDLVIIPLMDDTVTFWIGKTKINKDILICDHNLLQVQSLIRKSSNQYEFLRIIQCTSLEVIRHLVAHGCGVGILPTRVAKPDIYPTLHVFQENTPIYKDKVALIYRVDRQTSFAANTIIQSIKQSFD